MQNMDNETDQELQKKKRVNTQAAFNRHVKDEDALYKLMAYSQSRLRKRLESEDEHKDWLENPKKVLGFEDFEAFYSEQLVKDSMVEPRPIVEEELYPKRKIIESSLYYDAPWAEKEKE